MPRNPMVVGVVGTGLIGGSIAAALHRVGCFVLGSDANATAARRARRLGLVDRVVTSFAEFQEADIVFVAVPPSATVVVVENLLVAGVAVVTDVASVKSPIARALADRPNFVAGHPIAGREQSGPDAAQANLFDGRTWVIAPGGADPAAVEVVRRAVLMAGAVPVELGAAEHDRLVAAISHIPHLLASALVEMAAAMSALGFAGTGFLDLTRTAVGHPVLWTDILLHNRAAVIGGLDALLAVLERMRDDLADGNTAGVRASLAAAAVARATLGDANQPPEAMRSTG